MIGRCPGGGSASRAAGWHPIRRPVKLRAQPPGGPPSTARVRPISPPPRRLDAGTGAVINDASLAMVRSPIAAGIARHAPSTFPVAPPTHLQVPGEWAVLLREVVGAYQEAAAATHAQLFGVYLRGSLPRGLFLAGVSDVDTFGIAACAPAAPPPATAARHGSDGRATVGGAPGTTLGARVKALSARHAHLRFTKVEARLLTVPAGSAAAAALSAVVAAIEAPPVPPPPSAVDAPPPCASPAANRAAVSPLAAVLDQLPSSFQLKSQSVTLWGLDLPRLLPDLAALPPRAQLLPPLVEDVAAAVAAAERAASAEAPGGGAAAAPARWALKRCLRAARELCAPRLPSYTRDLWWCAEEAGEQLPQLRPQLQRALHLYVALGDSAPMSAPPSPQQQQGAALGGTAGARQQAAAAAAAVPSPVDATAEDVGEACRLATSLADALDEAFLATMLEEEPGWLTRHLPPSPRGDPGDGAHAAAAEQPTSPARSAPASASSSLWPLLWGRAAASAGAGVQQAQQAQQAQRRRRRGGLVGANPPPVHVLVAAPVRRLRWSDAAQRQEAADSLRAWLGGDGGSAACHRRGTAAGSVRPPPQALVLEGLGEGWPSRQWDLPWLEAQPWQGLVRVAPSLAFPYCEPLLRAHLAARKGRAACPSLEVSMPMPEFVERLHAGCTLPRVAYHPNEFYYAQAALPDELQPELPLQSLLQLLQQGDDVAAGVASGGAVRAGDDTAPPLSQRPRLWVSVRGSVSPTHFDLSPSLLLQLRGTKRMLLFPPEQLPLLYPYPETHLLRRRASANLAGAAPDLTRWPLLARARAVEAVLGPGDAVFFPSGWAHYTESLGGSDDGDGDVVMSVTCRLRPAGAEEGAAAAGRE